MKKFILLSLILFSQPISLLASRSNHLEDNKKSEKEESNTLAGTTCLFLSACSGFLAYEAYKSTLILDTSILDGLIKTIHQKYKFLARKENDLGRALKDKKERTTIGYGFSALFGSLSIAFGIRGIKLLTK